MIIRNLLLVVMPVLMLIQSAMVLHVHAEGQISEQHQTPHVHLFAGNHHHHHSEHIHSHHGHTDKNKMSGHSKQSVCNQIKPDHAILAGETQYDSPEEHDCEAEYELCFLVNPGNRLVLSDIMAGFDFLIFIGKKEVVLIGRALQRTNAVSTKSSDVLQMNGPDMIRNSLLRV